VRRHEIDYVSLVAGGLLLVVAGVHIAAGSADNELDVRWALPTLLLLLGVVGLLGALRGTQQVAVAAPGTAPTTPVDTAATDVDREPGSDRSADDDDDTEVLSRDEGTT
jgi:hypothetical protein